MLYGGLACNDRSAKRGSSCPGSGTRRPSRRRVLHASVRDGRQRSVYSRLIRQSRRFPSDKFKGASAALEVGAPEVPTKRWRSAWGDMEVTDSRCRGASSADLWSSAVRQRGPCQRRRGNAQAFAKVGRGAFLRGLGGGAASSTLRPCRIGQSGRSSPLQ